MQRTIGVQLDVASTDSVNAAVASAAAQFGRIDVLVNNAGNFRRGPSAELSDEDWHYVTNVHLDGSFRCARAAYPYLKQSNQGAIVSISSIAAKIALPQRLSYSAAKAGIEGLTRVLAVEWAKDGIRVNAVAPGFTESRNMADLEKSGLATSQKMIDATPLGRFAKTSEQADVIYFLGSPNSSFVTGQVIVVDGGATLDIRI
jgi:NAD(P)-dependent dehydrogenase (short-subunit alcohol dehydrogenase family)